MNDFFNSLSNEKDLIEITSNQFVANSPKVLKSLPSSQISPKFVNLDLGSDASERTLGLIWNINTDKLHLNQLPKIFPETNRGILSMIAEIYDLRSIRNLRSIRDSYTSFTEIKGNHSRFMER